MGMRTRDQGMTTFLLTPPLVAMYTYLDKCRTLGIRGYSIGDRFGAHQEKGNGKNPDPEERKRRVKLLKQGGVIIQHEHGSLQSVSPEEAENHLAAMEPERRVLYETIHPGDFDSKHYVGLRHHSQYGEEREQ